MANSKESISQSIQIKMTIKGKTKEMFIWLKDHYNLGYNAEVIRFIIKKVYDIEVKKS